MTPQQVCDNYKLPFWAYNEYTADGLLVLILIIALKRFFFTSFTTGEVNKKQNIRL